jgi:hypothetical protein
MTSEASQTLDHGLGALVMLLRFQGIGIDPKQIRHQFATDLLLLTPKSRQFSFQITYSLSGTDCFRLSRKWHVPRRYGFVE